MKIARRSLSLLLALLMVFSFAACGGGGEPTDETPDGDEGFVMPTRPVNETSGKNYVIVQHEAVENPFGYAQDSKMGLQVANRLSEIKELYGCTFEFRQFGYDYDFVTHMQAAQFTEDGGDIIFAYMNAMLRRCIGTGGDSSLMQDLLTVDNIIDFWNMEKWGNITARETMMANGTFYGVSPALWVDYTPLPYYQVVYNKGLIQAYGATDPQEYWEKEEWDRDAMLDVITKTTDEASGIWGMNARVEHMVRSTFLSTGMQLVSIDKINEDGTVEWSNNVKTNEAEEALTWLRNTLSKNSKCFNNGRYQLTGDGWGTYKPFNEGLCTMAMTRDVDLFDYVVVGDSKISLGLTCWAGKEANVLSGFYEDVCSIAIPVFAQNVTHSAFLIADLFEGLENVETYEDVLKFYSDTYFESELDLEMLVRPNAVLQYSYWPNDGIDGIWTSIGDKLLILSVTSLINKYAGTINTAVEKHIVPNKVALQKLSAEKDFD